MKSALRTDFFREIRKNRGRFISIFFIVALGAAFFAGIRSSEHDMKYSSDVYYDETNLMDIRVASTLGLDNQDLRQIRKLDGVSNAVGGNTAEVLYETDTAEYVLKLIAYSSDVNLPVVTEGRLPDKKGECLVDKQFTEGKNYQIGDTMTYHASKDSDISDTLEQDTYTIVGIGTIPYYVDMNRGSSSIGDGSIDGFVLLNSDDFVSDVYTEAYVQAEGTKDLSCYSDEYKELVQKVEDELGDVEVQACQRRYDTVQMDANELIAKAEKKIADGEKQLEDARVQLADGWQQLEDGKKELSDSYNQLTDYESQVTDTENTLANKRAELDAKGNASAEEYADLDKQQERLNYMKERLERGWNSYREGETTLADKTKELTDAQAEYDEESATSEQEIADARQEIADSRQELADMEIPSWYILNREKIYSYESFLSDAERMGTIGEVFPVMFFLVSALVSLTAMTRMIEEQRTAIGTLKALGYSDFKISMKYFSYAMLATIGGAVLGVIVGSISLPYIIMNAYGMMYTGFHQYFMPINSDQAALAIFLSVACTGLATIAASYKELNSKPAELMRPESPKSGKRVLLERIPIIWNHLNFTKKSTIRNLVRYKKRFFMTVVGIGGCMALMLVGFGIQDSITVIAQGQYTNIFTYDVSVSVNTDEDAEKQEELFSLYQMNDLVKDDEKVYSKTVDLNFGDNTQEVVMEVPEEAERMNKFVVFRDRTSEELYDFPENGIVITEKAAKTLGASVGDTITISVGDTEEVEAEIAVITENYVLHYIYMTPNLYTDLFQKEPEYNTMWIHMNENDIDSENELGKALTDQEACAGVTFISERVNDIGYMLRSLNLIIYVLIFSAGLLAVVVLYNLNSINITERKRELATLKVLGFYDGEVASYVYRENIILTAVGIFVGIFMGIALHRFIIQTVEVDAMMFGRIIRPISFLKAAGFAMLFSLLVNGIMYKRLKKIDMIESLKSVE